MPAPAFGSAGTYLNGANRTTTAVDAPAGVTAGQIVLVHLYIESTTAVTPPSGFTEVPGAANTTGPASMGRIFWKRSTGDGTDDDADTYSFTHATAFTEAVAERYTGVVGAGTPYDTGAGAPNSAQRSSAGTVTPGVSLTTQGADRLLVWSGTSVSLATWTPPTAGGTWTERVDTGREITVATKEQAAAGATGSVTGTASASDFQTAFLLALVPTGAVTGAAAANLPGLSATVAGTRTVGGAAVASLGGLTATVAGTVTPTVLAVANLGGLSATVAGTKTVGGVALAALPALVATVAGTRTVFAAAVANLGPLTATITGFPITGLGGSGAALNPVVWAVDRTTLEISDLLALWESLTLSPVANSPGACELVYPAAADGFDLLDANVDAQGNLDQEVEVWMSGSRQHRTRWLLQQKAGDRLLPGDLWRFTGAGLEQLLAEILVGPQDTETKELLFTTTVTYGQILIAAVDQAQDRDPSVLPGVTWDFTATHDSRGVAWSGTVTDLKFDPADTLLDVATIGPELGIGEFEVTPDRVLRAYNPDGRGTDLTVNTPPLRFAHAANVSEAGHRESSRAGDSATAVLGKGAEGVYEWAVDATAETARARRVEAVADVGKLTSSGAVTAAAQSQLDLLKLGTLERVHGVQFGARDPIPLVDFGVGDWVISQTGTSLTRQRIVQWTATFLAGGPAAGTVRTNDLIADRLTRLLTALERVKRGSAVVGTSTPSAEVDDGKAPAAPAGLVAESAGHAYVDDDGATWAAVLLDWSPVTTNADATPADDIVSYLPQFRYTGGAPLPGGWQSLPTTSETEADFDTVVANQPIEVRVAAIDRWGRQGAFSSAVALTSGSDASAPPTPSTPSAGNYFGILRVDWDGLGSVGESQPPDFQHTEVHVSTSSGFTPDPDPYPSGTRIGVMRGAGSFPWAPPTLVGGAGYDQTWFVKLVSVDRTGNRSGASAQDSAVTGQVEEGDVASVNIGVLTAGILNALLVIGDRIVTDTTGSRVEIDGAAGIFCINSSDEVVMSYDITAEEFEMIGKLTAGQGVGVGPTIVIDPSGTPRIRQYPSATAARMEAVAFTTTTATGVASTPVWIAQMISSAGATVGGFLEMWATGLVLGHQAAGAAIDGGALVALPTGEIFLQNTDLPLAFIQIQSDGDVVISSDDDGGITLTNQAGAGLDIFDDNVARMGSPNNNYVETSPSGSVLVSNGVVKAFTVDHPLDPDRVLRHGCVEGPEAGVIYRGDVRLDQRGRAVVDLPPYFEAATLVEHRSVHVQVLVDDAWFDQADVADTPLVPGAAVATLPRDGRFRVAAPAAAGMLVSWLVFARRRDVAEFDPEPLRVDVDVHGTGPYTWTEPGQHTGQRTGQPRPGEPHPVAEGRRPPGGRMPAPKLGRRQDT